LKIVVAGNCFFIFKDCKIKIKLYICNLKINKSIWYVCNRRDSRATIKVSKDLKVYVHRLTNEEGTTVSFDKVYLLDDNGVITIGAPIEGASVEAKVLQHLKGDKVIV
jgi:hypothetical protein